MIILALVYTLMLKFQLPSFYFKSEEKLDSNGSSPQKYKEMLIIADFSLQQHCQSRWYISYDYVYVNSMTLQQQLAIPHVQLKRVGDLSTRKKTKDQNMAEG